MALLSNLYKNTIGRVFSSPTGFKTSKAISKKRKLEEDEVQQPRRRKREDSAEDDGVITKRRRVAADRFAPIVDGQTFESTAIDAPSASEQTPRELSRHLMPPPPLNRLHLRRMNEGARRGSLNRRVSMDMDNTSQLSLGTRATHHRHDDSIMTDYDMEKARRLAAATTLPANSGVWEQAEKDLFYHLSYRGFEPLFPRNWMSDFPTMPLSLYPAEDDDEQPLIRVYKKNGQFRAIRELRELLDVGKDLRDKKLASPGVRCEVILEGAIKKYLKWSLVDAGVAKPSSSPSRHRALPLHIIVKQKPGQPTATCLIELKAKMHALREKHCRARNMHVSVERDDPSYRTPDSEGEDTYVAEGSDDDLPVLYGIMLFSSVLAIFTLNSRVPTPKAIAPYFNSTSRLSPALTESVAGMIEGPMLQFDMVDDTASDPRFISDHDFSDPTRDVWNALAIAILAMQVREDTLAHAQRRKSDDPVDELLVGIEQASVMDVDDDPDA